MSNIFKTLVSLFSQEQTQHQIKSQQEAFKAVEFYKPLLDAQRNMPHERSHYQVKKLWGLEEWVEINDHYVIKLIHMFAGHRCSLQKHEFKFETNYILKGEIELILEDDKGELKSYRYKAGDSFTTQIGRKHRVIALTNYTALEVSTTHLDDCIRFEDDYSRPSGKIDSEHIQNTK